MKTIAAILGCTFALVATLQAQKDPPISVETGQFELGIRSTMSVFDEEFNPGLGYGAHFRLRPAKRLQTEWYADYIKTGIPDVGHRETAHIGWSVMFYPFEPASEGVRFMPYVLAGHCFDYAKIHKNTAQNVLKHDTEPEVEELQESDPTRLTTAVQMGLGAQVYLNDRFNVSFSTQYMYHIGNSLKESSAGQETVLEGHLLATLSLNYLIADFIKPRL